MANDPKFLFISLISPSHRVLTSLSLCIRVCWWCASKSQKAAITSSSLISHATQCVHLPHEGHFHTTWQDFPLQISLPSLTLQENLSKHKKSKSKPISSEKIHQPWQRCTKRKKLMRRSLPRSLNPTFVLPYHMLMLEIMDPDFPLLHFSSQIVLLPREISRSKNLAIPPGMARFKDIDTRIRRKLRSADMLPISCFRSLRRS